MDYNAVQQAVASRTKEREMTEEDRPLLAHGAISDVQRRARQALVAVTLGGVAGLFFFFCFDPAKAGMFWRCPFHWLTGLYCPGCGGQRALHCLLHGDAGAALRLNAPTVVLFVPMAIYGYVGLAFRAFRRTELPEIRITPWRILVLAGVVMLYGLLRNLPWEPFTVLRP